jgi:hypothetical protein
MPRAQCIFCANKSGSKEHVWPEWLLEKLDTGHHKRIEGFIEGKEPFMMGGTKPELTTRSVCTQCNCGWMSALESSAMPIIIPAIDDISMSLNIEQQTTLTRWSMKTAMVFESMTPKCFYSEDERHNLRISLSIPSATFIWLGRYIGGNQLFNQGNAMNRVPPIPSAIPKGYVHSFCIGRLVIQIMTVRSVVMSDGTISVKERKGLWNDSTIQIWPSRGIIQWPPALSFTDDGPLSFDTLLQRWSPASN